MGRNNWVLVQSLGAQIMANYPDYRETEARVALAQREAEREQANQAEATRLYSRLKTAVGNNDWANVLTLADQIDLLVSNYRDVAQLRNRAHDYRETGERIASARREVEREQMNRAEAERLYSYLKVAVDNADWTNALAQAEQIDHLVPNYQDVAQLRERARRGQRQQQNQQRQNQPGKLWAQLRRLPTWGVGSVIVVILVLSLAVFLPPLMDDTNLDHTPTVTQTLTRSVVANNSSETPRPLTEVSTPTPPRTISPTLLDTLPSNPQLGDRWTRPADGMVMVYVPSGTFLMGSDPAVDEDAQSHEQPQHEVTLSGFWIDRTEVTNAQFAVFATETDYTTTAEIEGGGFIFVSGNYQYVDSANWRQPQGPGSNINELVNHPVVLVSWDDANAYCTWTGGQLPTEAQWEYAARGDDGRLYPWGDESPTCDLAQFVACDGGTVPVGSFPDGNSWVGAADMAGNVWEWVADWYDSDYYETSPSENPTGPTSGDYKVLHGGSWYNDPILLSVASRVTSFRPIDHIGFRCAVPPGS